MSIRQSHADCAHVASGVAVAALAAANLFALAAQAVAESRRRQAAWNRAVAAQNGADKQFVGAVALQLALTRRGAALASAS